MRSCQDRSRSSPGEIELSSIPEFRFADAQAYLCDRNTGATSLLVRLQALAPVHAPGQVYEYSHVNDFLLGVVIERATGRSCADLMQAYVLDPPEMRNTLPRDF